MRMRISAIVTLFSVAAVTASVGSARSEEMRISRFKSGALELVERQVRYAFPDISHITAAELADLMSRHPDRIVLLDVRTRNEHEISSLSGALRVPPEARRTSEIEGLEGSLHRKIVVAYCAIGLRSSRLLVRIGQSLRDRGAVELHNLEGGLFRWRNEERPLMGPNGPTVAIHGYNPLWRQLLRDDRYWAAR